ncbi:hypothetical protein LBMAG42_22160 [Deltaproteobacteria bacterium]|nr:hypothetical protein LBMAG42_22160 [Deltaproteobacteria bacterium]
MPLDRVRRVVFALGVALVAFCRVWLPSGATTVVGRPEGELRDHLWLSWVFARELWDRHALPLHTKLAAFPDGLSVYPLDPLHQAAIAMLEPAIGVVAAVNVVAFLLFAVLVYGGQKLASSAGAGVRAELACGALAAISPAFLGAFTDTQTEGMASGWLLLLLAELFSDSPRAGRAALWGCVLLATGPYMAHGVALVCVLAWVVRRFPLRASLPVIATALLLGSTLWTTEAGAGGALTARASQLTSATRPPRSTPLGVEAPPPLPDDGVVRHAASYPGAAETGPRRAAPWLFVALFLFSARDRRARIPAALALAYAAVAAGNRFGGNGEPVAFLTPYEAFWRWMPFAKYAWKPAQYAVPATAFALLAVARGWPRDPRRPGLAWLAGAVAIAAVLEATLREPTPLPLPASTLHPREAWSHLPPGGGAVIEFPCRDRSVPGHPPVADVLLGPLWHGRALGETPNRGAEGVHAMVLASLEGAITGHPSRKARPLGAALWEASEAGFTELLILGNVLGPEATARLKTALIEASVGLPEADGEGVIVVAIRR